MKKVIINIRHRTFTLNDEEILKLAASDKFRFKFTPIVIYNKKDTKSPELSHPVVVSFNDKAPFSLFEIGIPLSILRTYIGKNRIAREDLISAKKAFRELKNFASQCYERVIADLCCKIIMKEIHSDPNSHLIFFIEKSASDKLLGRLASLYLSLNRVTICFLVFDPSDLMTTVMSHQTGKLHFDIHRLGNSNVADFLGPYPGDSEDSLIQTYFYKPLALNSGGEYRPMRLDIFSQGLLRHEIDEKKELIKEIIKPDSQNIEHSRDKMEPRLLMPIGFDELKGGLDREEPEIRRRLLEIGDKQ